ncbi:MOSC N-terminal beta barrel domain-containing protein [Flavobacterium sp. ST-87]|uniref:MOSC N-terminal beta barrel domain-containing protein n=1 Tax=Flavobacterium plantiphilum TaxID=3163297 RepID=A0ABW8XT50_9FLAO
MLQLSEIWIYPVKSLGGIALKESKVMPRGLEHDRRWMLVDEHGVFITQREYPELALFQPEINNGFLKISYKGRQSEVLRISLNESAVKSENKVCVMVWEDEVHANEVSAEANNWFTDRLGFKVRLVYMPDESQRKVDPNYAVSQSDITSFSDGFPYLIIGQSSLDDLNSRLETALSVKRFRPNFVFTGGEPYEEESWKGFTIGNLDFFGVKPSGRCVIVTVNPESGAVDGKEPLRTLSKYKTVNKKVIFGQNVIALQQGSLKVGDEIAVLKKRSN